ncbi:MAG TPA: hypothetical protein PLW35_12405 [Verrucomicrobiota bacterium]|nr:hypothetical protein [Verrucomicrobiota bacterium]
MTRIIGTEANQPLPKPPARKSHPPPPLGFIHVFTPARFPGQSLTLYRPENNVPVPISACAGFPHRLRQPRIGTRDNLRAMPQSGGKTQTTSLSPYSGPHPDNEPGTLFASLLDVRVWQAAFTEIN